MIDLESPLFTEIAGVLRSTYKGITVYGEYVPAPAGFPSVSFVEMDNGTYLPARTNRITEQYAEVMYEVNVYSNLSRGKKNQARPSWTPSTRCFSSMGLSGSPCSPYRT